MKRMLTLFFWGLLPAAATAQAPHYLDTDDYAADPAAHVFEGAIHVYCTHDWASPVTDRTDGNHYDMRSYSHFTVDPRSGESLRRDSILILDRVPWASRQLWACDVACKEGRYYLFFPAKDRDDLFRIGVAVADRPEGPFVPAPEPIPGTYSIDPALFEDEGAFYLYFGGLQGGQLQRYADNRLLDENRLPDNDREALCARVARLSDDLRTLAEESRPVVILDADGHPLKAGDPHRFFEAAWVHKHDGTYYFSYSTGSGHEICYATGDNPYGPFTYRGVVLTPVVGWTTHQSICEYGGTWYLFYHDCVPSGGVSSLRSARFRELIHEPDGSIRTLPGKPDEEESQMKD